MDVQARDLAEENKYLQRCANDLVSVLALPAMWSGSEPKQIVDTLLDALVGMLRLDLVYVRLNDTAGQESIEMVRLFSSEKQIAPPDQIGEVLQNWLRAEPQESSLRERNLLGERELSIVSM